MTFASSSSSPPVPLRLRSQGVSGRRGARAPWPYFGAGRLLHVCLSRRVPPPPPLLRCCGSRRGRRKGGRAPFPRPFWLRSLRGATEGQGNPSGSSAASSASSSSPSPPQPLTLLVMMQPPGGGDGGEAVGAAMLQPPGVQATPGLASEAAPPSAQSSFMVFCDLVPAAAAAATAEVEGDGEAGGNGGGGLEDPEVEVEEEEEEESGAQAGGGGGSKSCTYQGCRETTTQVANQRKPWMCKRHRNKMYKDKYKRKKSDQALGQSGGGAGGGGGGGGGGGPASVSPGAAPSGGSGLRVEDCTEGSISVSKQRTGNIGDRPAKPTLLEQVLNHKRLSLLRSPEVVQFLQKRQQLLSQQAMEQRQQHFSGAPV